jgi:uncharacterized membrane protein YphA (DoxX/SURF4 family)
MRSLPLVVRLLSRVALAGVFLWAGLAKVTDLQGSINSVDAYDVLPDAAAELVGTLLPWAEVGLGALLLLGLFTRFAAAATAILTVVFLAAMAQAKARGLAIDCGCFGVSGTGDGVSWWDIARDVPILLASSYLAARPRGPWQLDNVFEGTEEIDGFDDVHEADEAPAPAGRR